MQRNRNVLNISNHLANQRKQAPIVEMNVYRLLQRATSNAHLPINICINGEQLSAIQQLSLSPSILLSTEVKLWTEVIGHRPIDNFLFSFPFKALQPFELTQILHSVASCFSLSESVNRIHRVVTSLEEITPEHVALLKGLGFNHYQLVVTTDDINHLDMLKSTVKLIRRFSFHGISLLIHETACLGSLRAQIIKIQEQIKPDFIYIGRHSKLIRTPSTSGDRIIFDDDNEPLANSLGLGPEGVSRFNDTQLQNYCKAETYTNALMQNKLPIRSINDTY